MDKQEILMSRIMMAMEEGELQAFYQPQFNPKKGVIAGAEALVRWVKKDGTIVPPMDFIPQLEACGKVQMVDWFVAECACKTLRKLGKRPVKISVNFSREHAKDKDFVRRLESLTTAYGVDKSYFGVEITESDMVVETKDVVEWITSIYEAGYNVLIDDFGTGMSSFSMVKDVPAHVIKIDRSFLKDNWQSEKGKITLETVFYYAHRMKLATIVEGVETIEQLYFLNTCDCGYVQGFLFSKPVPEEEFLRMWNESVSFEVDLRDPLEYKTSFGTVHLMIEAIYKKYPLIIFSNLSKNSFSIRRKEDVIGDLLPETGAYDEGFENMRQFLEPKYRADFTEAFSRENLFAAHARGEQKVVRLFRQKDEQGDDALISVEDYFMRNKYSEDLFIVTFMQVIKVEEAPLLE